MLNARLRLNGPGAIETVTHGWRCAGVLRGQQSTRVGEAAHLAGPIGEGPSAPLRVSCVLRFWQCLISLSTFTSFFAVWLSPRWCAPQALLSRLLCCVQASVRAWEAVGQPAVGYAHETHQVSKSPGLTLALMFFASYWSRSCSHRMLCWRSGVGRGEICRLQRNLVCTLTNGPSLSILKPMT